MRGLTFHESCPHFNPRSPCGERHPIAWRPAPRERNFNPRSPCGERLRVSRRRNRRGAFQSTLSLRRATFFAGGRGGHMMISIHALLAESDSRRRLCRKSNFISIHALLAESDRGQSALYRYGTDFNPRSPCGERPETAKSAQLKRFYFNPRSPCGERRARACVGVGQGLDFNPRSPCGERRVPLYAMAGNLRFQSTLSLRRATNKALSECSNEQISIHALLAESDLEISSDRSDLGISIHALLAESDCRNSRVDSARSFQSTLSLRRATLEISSDRSDLGISIHALLAESDVFLLG